MKRRFLSTFIFMFMIFLFMSFTGCVITDVINYPSKTISSDNQDVSDQRIEKVSIEPVDNQVKTDEDAKTTNPDDEKAEYINPIEPVISEDPGTSEDYETTSTEKLPTAIPDTEPEPVCEDDDSLTPSPIVEPEKVNEGDKAEKLLEQMTLREKVGQMFIIRPDALDAALSQEVIEDPYAPGVTSLNPQLKEMLNRYPVGGFVIFSKNITTPEQVMAFNIELQSASSISPFLCIDEEGGLVARLANHPAFDLPKYSSAADVGKNGNINDAYQMGNQIGAYLHKYGFNVDFAPDADVNTNPDNPVIGTRSFSSDPTLAASLARAMADGLDQNGIMPVFKHFPGHGDTKEDSHAEIAITYKTQKEMASCEWLPFCEAGAYDGIMVGHIAIPEITGTLIPATMSHEMITDILRNQLGFHGVIITDALTMKAITNSYTPGEAATSAINAGCEILLGPGEFQTTFDELVTAVENNIIPESLLNEIVYHILTCKEMRGII